MISHIITSNRSTACTDSEELSSTPETVHTVDWGYVVMRLVLTKAKVKTIRGIRRWIYAITHAFGAVRRRKNTWGCNILINSLPCKIPDWTCDMRQFPFGVGMLAEGELASHAHIVYAGYGSQEGTEIDHPITNRNSVWNNRKTSSVGGDQPHNNIPPLYGVNRFRRISWYV